MNQVEKKSLFLKEKLNPPGTMRYVCADKIILYFGKKIAVSFLLNYVCGILKRKNTYVLEFGETPLLLDTK